MMSCRLCSSERGVREGYCKRCARHLGFVACETCRRWRVPTDLTSKETASRAGRAHVAVRYGADFRRSESAEAKSHSVFLLLPLSPHSLFGQGWSNQVDPGPQTGLLAA